MSLATPGRVPGLAGNLLTAVLVLRASCAGRLARRVGPEGPHARRAGPGPRGGTRSGQPLTA
jgi:hypothetical protein